MKCSIKKTKGRRKALFGIDGLISGGMNAAATMSAAAMQAKATADAAKTQAEAVKRNAEIQSQSIKDQTINNTNLQKQSIEFTRQQNKESRQQQQDIQTTLQMLAGQQNMNDRLNASRVAVKYGGNRRKLKYITPFYGGGNAPFTVTDGGGVVPIDIDANGYGLYEIQGNDHEHYHKTRGGKYKSGVGFRFPDGSVVEGEGNQNSNKGEKLFVTPEDALFISKHSINGFNPAKAVDNGMNPVDAFMYQEAIKSANGYNSDGTKKRRKLKNIASFGTDVILDNVNQTVYPSNNTGNAVAGAMYINNSSPVEERTNRNISLKKGGRIKCEEGFWNNYGGAFMNSAGSFLGAGIGMLGNYFAGRTLSKAYNKAGTILSDAYSQMKGIDMSAIDRSSYVPAHAMAVIRSADTNINPQLERLRRNAAAERININRNTLSSAARQQRLAGVNDRMYQRMSEAYADKHNRDEQIKQANAEQLSKTSQFNAEQDLKASERYMQDYLGLLQYNNDIENEKIMGMAGAKADALTQVASIKGQYRTQNAGLLGSALTTTGNAFGNAFDSIRTRRDNYENIYSGANFDNQISMALAKNDKNKIAALRSQVDAVLSDPNIANSTREQYQIYKLRLNS